MDINYILGLEESSLFDRKSIKIKPKELAKHIIAFANSDGGMIAIGITDKNRIIEGIDYYEEKINEILEVPFRYCFPSIRVKSKRIGYSKDEISYLEENKGFLKEKNGKEVLSTAAILLFGKRAQDFLPRARVRFIKYEGIEEKTGAEMNVVKDIVFEGKIYDMLKKTIEYIDSQIKEKTFLEKDGRFVTIEEYPKFVRQELVVNAITHRDYSIRGTEIQIKMFDNRLVVESPGKLPGLVKKDNMRHTHFSRNPKIAEYLKYFGYVKEYGEGVDRIYKELKEAGFKEVEYYMDTFILKAIVFNNKVDSSKLQYIIQSDDTLGNKKVISDDFSDTLGNKKVISDDFGDTLGNKINDYKYIKLSKISMERLLETKKFPREVVENILKVYDEVETNQIIGNLEVSKILGKSKSTAIRVMKKLKEIDVIVQVNGKGRGKYRFKYESEIKNKK